MKRILNSLAIGVMVLAMTSCNKQPQANDTKKSEKIETTVQTSEGQKIAYVDIDSIMSQYTYWKEVKKVMKNKENTSRQATITSASRCELPTEHSSK